MCIRDRLSLDDSQLTPIQVTAGIFQCLADNSDLCVVTLGNYGDKAFAMRLLNMGREKCMESYTRYFEAVSYTHLPLSAKRDS